MTQSDREATASDLIAALSVRRQQPTGEYQRPKSVHKIPVNNVRLDGALCPPEAVQQYEGQPLCIVLDENAQRAGEAAIFTSVEDAAEQTGAILPTLSTGEAAAPNRTQLANFSGRAFFGMVDLFEDTNFAGRQWTFYTEWGAIPDFRRVYPTLWWATNIDNMVSSMDVNVSVAAGLGRHAFVALCSDVGYAGSQIWISSSFSYPPDTGGGQVSDLGRWGFSDTASSLYYGFYS
jgi:hypothetical protein